MYEESYGLREKPFSLVPDPDFLFLSRLHKGALDMLEHAVRDQASFVLISGEVGTGKTILVRRFLRMIGDRVAFGVVTSTPRNKSSVLDRILLAFGLDHRGKTQAEQQEIFVNFLKAQKARNRRTILVIDEAQNLDVKALEELHALCSTNVDKDVLLQVVLVGQPEILEILNRRELGQLAQRITLKFQLQPLSFPETRNYIRHRLSVAGGNPQTFSPEACGVIYLLSGGLPRLINSLSDLALVYGYGKEQVVLDGETVIEVAIDTARGGLVQFPGVDANFDADEVLRHARQLSSEIGPDDDLELPEPITQPDGGSEEVLYRVRPLLDEEHLVGTREHVVRKRKYITVSALALSALVTAGLIWTFKLNLSGPAGGDSFQSVNMDAGKATPSVSPGPATDRVGGVAANQPETAPQPSVTPSLIPEKPAESPAADVAQPEQLTSNALEETTPSTTEQPAGPDPATVQPEPSPESLSAIASQPVASAEDMPTIDQSAEAIPSEAAQPEQQAVADESIAPPAQLEPEPDGGTESAAADVAQPEQLASNALEETTSSTTDEPASPDPAAVQPEPSPESLSATALQPVAPAEDMPTIDQSAEAIPSGAAQPEQQAVAEESIAPLAQLEPEVEGGTEPAAADVAQPLQSDSSTLTETTPSIIEEPAGSGPATVQPEPTPESVSATASQPVASAEDMPMLDQSTKAIPSRAAQPEQPTVVAGKTSRPNPVKPEENVAGTSSDETPRRQPVANLETGQPEAKIAAATPPPSAVKDAPTTTSSQAKIASITPPTPRLESSPRTLSEMLARNDVGQYVGAFEGLFGIWKLNYSSLGGVSPCHKAFAAGLSCYEHSGTLAKLRRLNLPAIIGLRRPSGDLAYAVLIGISRSHAKLRFGNKEIMAPIYEVSTRLTGPSILLWKSQIQFSGDIWEGSRGDNVAWLRDSLDKIMPEGFRPGKGTYYSSAVTRAVKEFQKYHGLRADGVVDVETLIALGNALHDNRIPSLEKL